MMCIEHERIYWMVLPHHAFWPTVFLYQAWICLSLGSIHRPNPDVAVLGAYTISGCWPTSLRNHDNYSFCQYHTVVG